MMVPGGSLHRIVGQKSGLVAHVGLLGEARGKRKRQAASSHQCADEMPKIEHANLFFTANGYNNGTIKSQAAVCGKQRIDAAAMP
jgi:hypothetical protein